MSKGGEVGSRGYVFQAIVALMDCLERHDWDEIKVEPKTDQDKVDIQLYSNGEILSAIQVKSSVNAFKKSDAQNYLDAARIDAPDAKEVYLYLITDKYTESIKQYAHNKPDVKEFPFEYLEDACKGKLINYVDRIGLAREITASDIILLYKSLFATLMLNSKDTKPISRTVFEAEFQRAIPVSKTDKSQPEISKCLTPIPAVNQNVGLIGRDGIVKTVREHLEKNNGTALVNGLGGIGKTAVMLYVCNKLKDEGHYVAWFKWENSLKEGLLLLRDKLEISKTEKADEAYELVISAIENRLAGKLYLFIDDLTRRLSDDEISLLNSLPIHVMVTSRFKYEYFKNVPLDVLEKDAAIDMFFMYYQRDRKTENEDIAWSIIDFVHSHTLLVELLAKAAREEGGTLIKFYDTLRDKGFFEVSDEEVKSEHDKEYRTIEQSIIKLYAISNLSEAEQHIMRLFTIFTPEKVIYSKVRDWAGLDRKAMRNLVELGWLDRGKDGYVIHQIVKDSLSKQVGEVRLEDYGNLLDKLIDTDSYLSVTETYEVVRERIVLAEDIAGYLWVTYQANSERDEKWTPDAGWLMNNLAGVYCEQGDYGKALEYFRKELNIRERVLGTEHSDTATTYNNLANVYKDQGDYEKALEYYGKALAIRERVLGSEHSDTADTYNNLANVYHEHGDYEKALEYHGKALAIKGRVLGRDHPNTATTYNNLAVVYYVQGDYEKALEYYGKALAIRERVLDREHPYTAATYNNMANVYADQGDYEKALEYYQRALKVYLDTFGDKHPGTKKIRDNLTRLQRKNK